MSYYEIVQADIDGTTKQWLCEVHPGSWEEPSSSEPLAPVEDLLQPLETRVEYGHQTLEMGWIPEHRGIKYATQQRTVHFRIDEPVMIDHWTDPDNRGPVGSVSPG